MKHGQRVCEGCGTGIWPNQAWQHSVCVAGKEGGKDPASTRSSLKGGDDIEPVRPSLVSNIPDRLQALLVDAVAAIGEDEVAELLKLAARTPKPRERKDYMRDYQREYMRKRRAAAKAGKSGSLTSTDACWARVILRRRDPSSGD
jgi:hypothetical protein